MKPLCLSCEACCCTGPMVARNRYLIQTRFGRVNTDCDNCLISFTACLQCLACIVSCLACLAGDKNDNAGDVCLLLGDLVQCGVMGCFLVQQQAELDYMKSSGNTYTGPPQLIYDALPAPQQKMIDS